MKLAQVNGNIIVTLSLTNCISLIVKAIILNPELQHINCVLTEHDIFMPLKVYLEMWQ
jgi:hypothetical protein